MGAGLLGSGIQCLPSPIVATQIRTLHPSLCPDVVVPTYVWRQQPCHHLKGQLTTRTTPQQSRAIASGRYTTVCTWTPLPSTARAPMCTLDTPLTKLSQHSCGRSRHSSCHSKSQWLGWHQCHEQKQSW